MSFQVSQSLMIDRPCMLLLGMAARATLRVDYLGLQRRSAGSAYRQALGAPLDWSVDSGSIKPVAYD
jgi:hypothetical protein